PLHGVAGRERQCGDKHHGDKAHRSLQGLRRFMRGRANRQGGEMAGDTDALTQRIFDAVDANWERQLAFTRELIRYPSLRGREHTAQEFVHAELSARGYAMDRWTIDVDAIRDHPGFSPVAVSYENAVNVVGTHTPRQATGRSLILNGHIDVVPEGPHDMWTRPPFEPAVEGDWLYG